MYADSYNKRGLEALTAALKQRAGDKAFLTVKDLVNLGYGSSATIYREIDSGEIPAMRTVNGRVLIFIDELIARFESLSAAKPRDNKEYLSPLSVSLLQYTPDPERTVAVAARVCYSDLPATDLAENLDDEEIERILGIILDSGHFSALEHASFTFAIDGVSRSLTHQLVRHRLASFNQRSQRYVSEAKKSQKCFNYVLPPSVDEKDCTYDIFTDAMNAVNDAYRKLIKAGVPKEDARYVLPNACASSIVVTMNVRELRHFFSLRCCNRAQWEIREMAWKMLELAREVAPILFADAGPECVRTKCPEGKMSCHNPYAKRLRPTRS